MKTFTLPDLGEGLQEAEIVSWHVGVGDRVVADQPLVSVETAKAVVEMPAPWSGRIASLHAKVGDVVPIGAPLADIETDAPEADAGAVVGRLDTSPASPAPRPTEAAPTPQPAVKASPAVRALARERGIDLSGLAGTGPAGSLTREDVEAAHQRRAPGAAGEPLKGVRRAMAIAMQSAAAVIAATVTDEAIIDGWTPETDPTIRLVRAVVAGCAAAPALNAWYDPAGTSRKLHSTIDIGVAVETGDGLLVPVLRDAGSRTDAQVRGDLERLKRDAPERRLALSDLTGQTISLSNFGMLGGLTAALTIMPPQVAILGAGRIHAAPRIVDGAMRVARVLPLSLTFDHRAVTGAEAIKFLTAAIRALSQP